MVYFAKGAFSQEIHWKQRSPNTMLLSLKTGHIPGNAMVKMHSGPGDITWLGVCSLNVHEVLVQSPAPHKLGTLAHLYNSNTWEGEEGESEVHSELARLLDVWSHLSPCLNSIPRYQEVAGDSWLLRTVLWPSHICCGTGMTVLTHTNTCAHKSLISLKKFKAILGYIVSWWPSLRYIRPFQKLKFCLHFPLFKEVFKLCALLWIVCVVVLIQIYLKRTSLLYFQSSKFLSRL